jgi:ribonuclease-3
MRLKLIKDGGTQSNPRPQKSQIINEHSVSKSTVAKSIEQPHQPLGPEHYGELEALLGYTFIDKSWLERALTHRSVQVNGVKSDYERLEFLGDAVFDLAVAHLLLDSHLEANEGELSKMRAALVNTASLANIARKLELGRFIRLSRGELASGAHERPSILADVVEAIMGAVYREAGFAVAQGCVAHLLGDSVTTVTPRDPKTELQEALHAKGSEPPVYRLECVEGPEHSPTFISIVEVGGRLMGRGRGGTKKASQQAAAEEALNSLRPQTVNDVSFSLSVADESSSDDNDGSSSPEELQATTETNHE